MESDSAEVANPCHIVTEEVPQESTAATARAEHLQAELDSFKKQNLELRKLAFSDPVTQLPNRQWLMTRLPDVLRTLGQDLQLALVYLGIDQFKRINDSIGHQGGDALLRAMGRRLSDGAADNVTVAHIGGDRFVVLSTSYDAAATAQCLAAKVAEMLIEPFTLGDHTVSIKCSIGISLFPQDAATVGDLLDHAQVAWRRAKSIEPSGYDLSAPSAGNVSGARELEVELRSALHEGSLSLYYQPQVDLATGAVAGVEALLRWQHPSRGLLTAAPLITLAEESDLIQDLGDWALRTACAQLQSWQRQGQSSIAVAVNLSARQFLRSDLIARIKSALAEFEVRPDRLKLELTESVLVQDIDYAASILHQLTAMGVRIAIDDFGIGYSSLNYLKHFPLDCLKIDRSFVSHLTTEPADAAIVNAVIALAHGMNLQVIAEGVETEEQLAYLRAKQCDSIQGFYFSPAVPAKALSLGAPLVQASAPGDKPSKLPSVLVVDDDDAMAAYLGAVLQAAGYDVATEHCAEDGFARLARQPIELVIADYRMPEISGTDFLRRVRHLHPKTVRILVSAHADTSALTDAINDGAIFRFLTKPVAEQALLETARLALRHLRSGAVVQS